MKYVHNRKEAERDQFNPIRTKREDEKVWLDPKNSPMDFAYTKSTIDRLLNYAFR
jgi:hypothetical protein